MEQRILGILSMVVFAGLGIYVLVSMSGCATNPEAKIPVMMICVEDASALNVAGDLAIQGFSNGERHYYQFTMHGVPSRNTPEVLERCSEALRVQTEIVYDVMAGLRPEVETINVLTAEQVTCTGNGCVSAHKVRWQDNKIGRTKGRFSFRFSAEPVVPSVTTQGIMSKDVKFGGWWEK